MILPTSGRIFRNAIWIFRLKHCKFEWRFTEISEINTRIWNNSISLQLFIFWSQYWPNSFFCKLEHWKFAKLCKQWTYVRNLWKIKNIFTDDRLIFYILCSSNPFVELNDPTAFIGCHGTEEIVMDESGTGLASVEEMLDHIWNESFCRLVTDKKVEKCKYSELCSTIKIGLKLGCLWTGIW